MYLDSTPNAIHLLELWKQEIAETSGFQDQVWKTAMSCANSAFHSAWKRRYARILELCGNNAADEGQAESSGVSPVMCACLYLRYRGLPHVSGNMDRHYHKMLLVV